MLGGTSISWWGVQSVAVSGGVMAAVAAVSVAALGLWLKKREG